LEVKEKSVLEEYEEKKLVCLENFSDKKHKKVFKIALLQPFIPAALLQPFISAALLQNFFLSFSPQQCNTNQCLTCHFQ